MWLRAALSEWQEADSGSARALLTAFVDGRLRELAQADWQQRRHRMPDRQRIAEQGSQRLGHLRGQVMGEPGLRLQ